MRRWRDNLGHLFKSWLNCFLPHEAALAQSAPHTYTTRTNTSHIHTHTGNQTFRHLQYAFVCALWCKQLRRARSANPQHTFLSSFVIRTHAGFMGSVSSREVSECCDEYEKDINHVVAFRFQPNRRRMGGFGIGMQLKIIFIVDKS